MRQLCERNLELVASPAYINRSKSIGKPSDLAGHNWVLHPEDPLVNFGGMPLKGPNNMEAALQIRHRVTTNSAQYVKDLVLAGLGIALYPRQNMEHELASGALVRLLPEWLLPTASVYVAYTHRNALTSIARLFLDKVLADFRDDR